MIALPALEKAPNDVCPSEVPPSPALTAEPLLVIVALAAVAVRTAESPTNVVWPPLASAMVPAKLVIVAPAAVDVLTKSSCPPGEKEAPTVAPRLKKLALPAVEAF